MRGSLILLTLLAGCGASPEPVFTGLIGLTAASVAVIHRTPLDAVWSLVSGKDCSAVRLDRGESYCRAEEPPPVPPPFCTKGLGRVDCWTDPWRLPGRPTETADGPRLLTPEQEAHRTRGWP